MRHDDVDYFERRAEEEIELARSASDNRAVQAHYDLASAYLEKIHPKEARQEPAQV